MNTDITKLCNQLYNVLHELDLHVAPADATGKRLVHEAHVILRAISATAQQSPDPS